MAVVLLALVLPSTIFAIQGNQCGTVRDENDLRDRVIGGHVSQKRKWPWLVEVITCRNETRCLHCTGTIVSDRYVLTAAHCFKNIEPKYESRRLTKQNVTVSSRLNGDKDNKKGGWADVETNFIMHPKYEESFADYDVAIVELITQLKFSEQDQPICIVESFREIIGEVGYVAGYGSASVNETVLVNYTVVDENGAARNKSTWSVMYNAGDGEVHENIVLFRTVERCASVTKPLEFMTRHSENAICAVGNKRDTAKGDSGGPLMINRKGTWYQVGTTTMGNLFEDDDGRTKWYCLYTRLSRACDWIEGVTNGYVQCISVGD